MKTGIQLSCLLLYASAFGFGLNSPAVCGQFKQQFWYNFKWPTSVSNSGPYTVASGVSNYLIASPSGGAILEGSPTTHQYHHHTRISWDDPTIAVACSSAYTNEADSGMQTHIYFSTNMGVNWSAATVVVPSQSIWTNVPYGSTTIGQRISYPRDFQTHSGTNWLVCAVDHYYTTAYREVGDALFACAVFTNQTIGTLYRISTNDYYQSNGYPAVLPDFNQPLSDLLMSNTIVFGHWGGRSNVAPTTVWNHWVDYTGINVFVEPTTFSADGSRANLHRLWRSGLMSDRLHQSFSRDSGATWTQINICQVPNAPTASTALRLSDGRFCIVTNPKDTTGQDRDPLFMALTGVNSMTVTNVLAIRQGLVQTPTYAGWGKHGGASYASAVQAGTNLLVAYSLQKESLGFSVVPIP